MYAINNNRKLNSATSQLKQFASFLFLITISACSGSGDNTPTGTITFWADQTTVFVGAGGNACGTEKIRVTVDGVDIGELTARVPAPTKCGFDDVTIITRNLTEGLHVFSATNGICSVAAKDIKVVANTCVFQVITKP